MTARTGQPGTAVALGRVSATGVLDAGSAKDIFSVTRITDGRYCVVRRIRNYGEERGRHDRAGWCRDRGRRRLCDGRLHQRHRSPDVHRRRHLHGQRLQHQHQLGRQAAPRHSAGALLRSNRGAANPRADHGGPRQGHRSRAEAAGHGARHGARGARRGRSRRRHDRAHRRRLSLALELREPGERASVAAPGSRVGLTRLRRHEPGRARRADAEAARRDHRAHEGDLRRCVHAGPRGRERQGRRRQVDSLGESRGRLRPARAAHRDPGRGRLRPLDPAHARSHAAPGRRRQDDRPAGARRPEADVDRLLPRGELAGHVARADAPSRARAVSLRRALGRARHPGRRHAAREPGTSRSRSGSCCRARR